MVCGRRCAETLPGRARTRPHAPCRSATQGIPEAQPTERGVPRPKPYSDHGPQPSTPAIHGVRPLTALLFPHPYGFAEMLDNVWSLFQDRIFSVPSTDELFNLYRDRHPDLDVAGAPEIRRDNLRRYLRCFDAAPPLFLLAEAPGPWGCRFSGVPITSEAQLADDAFPIDGDRTSAEVDLHSEYSAGIFWRVLQPSFPDFFVWNSVPLHPHDPGEPLSIRNPRRTEVRDWQDLLVDLVALLQPDRVLGIGRKAERALTEAGVDVTYVRHPSQGGANRFEAGVREVLDDLRRSGA